MRSLSLFVHLSNPSSRTMVLELTLPLREISTCNLPGGNGWPARKADLTAICEPTVYNMWRPLLLTTLWASTACYRTRFTYTFKRHFSVVSFKILYSFERNGPPSSRFQTLLECETNKEFWLPLIKPTFLLTCFQSSRSCSGNVIGYSTTFQHSVALCTSDRMFHFGCAASVNIYSSSLYLQ
jgi:hypothetical protein